MVAVAEHRLTDGQLAEQTAAGDAQAFAALFERHLQGVYDLALRVLRDEAAAVDAVTESFANVWGGLRRGARDGVRAYIYAAAHNAAVTRARRGRGSLDGGRFTALDAGRLADPAPILRDPELVDIVWESASALDARDYALLDLQLRKGLTPNELAAELGFKQATLDARLARLKDKVVASVAAARAGGPPARVSPLAIFAALAPVTPPAALSQAVWTRLAERPVRSTKDRWRPSSRVLVLVVASACFVAATTAGALVLLGGAGTQDPSDVRSTSHQVGVETSDATIAVGWTPAPGATGYSISWSSEPELPDETVDLAGNLARASRVVTPGTWWFNLRTRGPDGDWSHTVHLGPYVVVAVPNTKIAARPSKLSNDGKPTFTLQATGEGTFECSLDGAPFERCGERVAVGHLDEGSHRFEARVRDRYGNADETPASWVWRVDSTAPRTKITSAHLEKDTAKFAFTGGKERVTFECKLDDSGFSRCKSPVSLEDLSEGEHELFVRATDAAGNRDRTPATERWTIDTRRPKTKIVSGPSGIVHRPSASFALDANEDEVAFECSLDGHAFSPCSSRVEYVGLASGEHAFEARARDEAGNVDRTPARRIWTVVDTKRPETTIVSHPAKSSSDSSPTFTFRSSEAGSRFECRLDAGPWRSCSSPKTYAGLAPGQHAFRVRARDASGNVDRTAATWTWNVH